MYLTQNSRIVFKFCLLNLFILLTAGSSLYGLQDVRDDPESMSVEDNQQAQQPESGNISSDKALFQFKRLELLEKTMLKKLNLESLPIVTQNERPALSSPVIRAFLQKYGIDLEHLQNEEDDIDDEIKNQTLLITAKQPPFTTVTSFLNWFYFEFSPNERINFRVKSANIWFYVKNTSSFTASATVKLDVMRPYVNQTSDEVVYIPMSHSSEILNLNERKNSETWKYISITSLAENWLRDPTTNFGVKLYTIDVMNLIASGLLPGEEEYTPFLEVELVADHPRRKRNAGNQQSCQQENGTNGCCLVDLIVNFHDIGWDWIIYPQWYNAKDCAGECSLQLTTNIHSTITHANFRENTTSESVENGQPNQLQFCCAPTKYAPLNLLYLDNDRIVIFSEVPDLVITKCGCV